MKLNCCVTIVYPDVSDDEYRDIMDEIARVTALVMEGEEDDDGLLEVDAS